MLEQLASPHADLLFSCSLHGLPHQYRAVRGLIKVCDRQCAFRQLCLSKFNCSPCIDNNIVYRETMHCMQLTCWCALISPASVLHLHSTLFLLHICKNPTKAPLPVVAVNAQPTSRQLAPYMTCANAQRFDVTRTFTTKPIPACPVTPYWHCFLPTGHALPSTCPGAPVHKYRPSYQRVLVKRSLRRPVLVTHVLPGSRQGAEPPVI